jgi:hypothetical protein
VFSHSVLQYIPAPVLANMLAEFKRIARPDAVMVHYINLQDQYHAFDKSISPLHFLRYSDRAWRWWWRSPLTPLNRLRLSDYRSLITSAGFEIVREFNTSAPPEELDRIKLAREFEKFSREDLLVLTSRLICRVKQP